MFIKLLPPNNDLETTHELNFDFVAPANWVWSELHENLDMARNRGTKRNSEIDDLQEIKHQLFDKDIDTFQTEMSVEKHALETRLHENQEKLNKATEDRATLDAQLQKLAAEKEANETNLSNYAAQTQECGKKIASVDIILKGFSEYVSYKN